MITAISKNVKNIFKKLNESPFISFVPYASAILLVAAATKSLDYKLSSMALQFNAALAVQDVEHAIQLKALSLEVARLSKAVSVVAEISNRSKTFVQKIFVEATYFDVALNTLAVIIGIAGAGMIICAVLSKGGPGIPPAGSDECQETIEKLLSTADAGQVVLENLISSVEAGEDILKNLVPYVDAGAEALDGLMSSGQTGEAVLGRLVQVLLTRQQGEDAMEAVGQLVQEAVLQRVAESTESVLSSVNNVETIQLLVADKLELICTALLTIAKDDSLGQAACSIAELLAKGGGGPI